ncbi:hypothetical protein DFH06DRAFT_1157999 [Mycena polygramma]|nr:hypothetical protein DFH06DRAFT_1157999 [Mycena polygramma]
MCSSLWLASIHGTVRSVSCIIGVRAQRSYKGNYGACQRMLEYDHQAKSVLRPKDGNLAKGHFGFVHLNTFDVAVAASNGANNRGIPWQAVEHVPWRYNVQSSAVTLVRHKHT